MYSCSQHQGSSNSIASFLSNRGAVFVLIVTPMLGSGQCRHLADAGVWRFARAGAGFWLWRANY